MTVVIMRNSDGQLLQNSYEKSNLKRFSLYA